ncbi:16S rRNA (cytosine(967)-C(5))-methyltransferase RsmB, partial [Candidatus Deferrimicrobium sp.]|uniref:16S rRNA (cytosine(967)-C(5))-methyltransferase RsmB n=1 Tax=Candidatus Deferrimicrobium sp. TaxID=3060586 RepID=UPI002ED9F689
MGVRPGTARGGGGTAIVRDAAISVLSRVDRDEAFADIVLDRALRDAGFSDSRDRGLLTELVMGTLRRRGTIDFALLPFLSRPLEQTDAYVRNALRVGAYQLFYTRIPDRAALNETVAAVKASRGGGAGGFVNAVLRGIVRAGKIPVLPPEGDPRRLPAEFSAPRDLIDALTASLGEAETRAYLAACLGKPPFAVRANPFRVVTDALARRFADEGKDPAPCRYAPDGFVLGKPAPVFSDAAFLEGAYLVMDEGAQLIAPLLRPAPGDRILDACAAPGGKTTHLSALADGKAEILAADVSALRLRMLREVVTRTGAPGIRTALHDLSRAPLPPSSGLFDKVLVDAPCTGMGVIRRNPDAKWRFRPDGPRRMARVQAAILRNAWEAVRRGGILLYCTCSPLMEEDEEVVAAFLAERPEAAVVARPDFDPCPADAWTADGFLRLYPHRHGTDAFFAALLRKNAEQGR